MLWMRNTELPEGIKWIVVIPTIDAFIHLGHLYYFLQTHTPLPYPKTAEEIRQEQEEQEEEKKQEEERKRTIEATAEEMENKESHQEAGLHEHPMTKDRAVMFASFAPNTKAIMFTSRTPF